MLTLVFALDDAAAEDVRKVTGIRSRQTKGSQRIRDDIRGSRQILTGCSGKVHDAFDAIQHIPGLPAGHRHIFHSGGGFGGRELGLATHLAGFGTELVKVIPCCTGNSRDLAHFLVEVCCGLYRRCA